MWMSRTSRGRRDLPLSLREVEGIWVGWALGLVFAAGAVLGLLVAVVVVGAAGAVVVVVVFWDAVGWVLDGSAGGVMG